MTISKQRKINPLPSRAMGALLRIKMNKTDESLNLKRSRKARNMRKAPSAVWHGFFASGTPFASACGIADVLPSRGGCQSNTGMPRRPLAISPRLLYFSLGMTARCNLHADCKRRAAPVFGRTKSRVLCNGWSFMRRVFRRNGERRPRNQRFRGARGFLFRGIPARRPVCNRLKKLQYLISSTENLRKNHARPHGRANSRVKCRRFPE